MSEDSVIILAELNSSQADNKSAFQAAVSPSPVVVAEENVAGEREARRVLWEVQRDQLK